MKRVVVVSPFRASPSRSRKYHTVFAKLLCLAVAHAGHAPFASHLFYPAFLDDNDEVDRATGLACEHAWIERCDELWVWDHWGISQGMQAAIDHAEEWSRPYDHKPIVILSFSKGEIPEWQDLAESEP